jgi:hypothetical protein
MKCLLLLALLAQNAVLAPSGLLDSPSKFDHQNVTALGVAQNVAVHSAGPGTIYTTFQLCDSQCVNVVNSGPPKAVNGQNATVNGTFYRFYSHGPVTAHNIIVVAAAN